MLSIKSMTGIDVADYYLNLAREDYYLNGGEPPGEWMGVGALNLSLKGRVTKDELRAVLTGLSPVDGTNLTQNAGTKSRHSGWDLTFSAPKSVSVLWALSNQETRSLIESAHREAVKGVISILEREHVLSRRGKGGKEFERAALVAASFEHSTSRALDPHLHSHVLVSNLGKRSDGTWGTIVGRPLFDNKMALGALYRAELTRRLSHDFDLEWVRDKNLIEVKNVKKELLQLFAKRRQEIEDLLHLRGESGARASEMAALATRESKEPVARAQLFRIWGEEAKESKIKLPLLKRRSGEIKKQLSSFDGVLSELVRSQSYFSVWDLVRKAAERSMGTGEGAENIISRCRRFLSETPEALFLAEDRLKKLYTTKSMYEAEKGLLSLFGTNGSSVLSSVERTDEIAKSEGLNQEQSRALSFIGQGKPLTVISGMAGTGKSTLLKSGAKLLREAGLEVIGTAPTGKAAEGLEKEAGIKSMTLDKLFFEIGAGNLALTAKSVLIIDEAAMVGTLALKRAADLVALSGGRLILLGDERQIQPILAGGPFQGLFKKYGGAVLTSIRRQRSEFDRERIFELVAGDAKSALSMYAKTGRLKVGESGPDTVRDLLCCWKERGGLTAPQSNLILAGENFRVDALNRAAQELRRLSGCLGSVSLEVSGQKFFSGDRILFTRNSKNLQVKNGSLGVIIKVHRLRGQLTVLLDSGKTVQFKPVHYPHIKLGYAVTTHKAQGLTTENAFILLGGALQDREISYVQASRARGETHFFVSKEDAGEGLKRIAFVASVSHRKLLATDVRAP